MKKFAWTWYSTIAFSIVILMIGCATMKGGWENASRINTIAAYEEFIKKYPDSDYVAQAGERLKTLYEERAWQKTSVADSTAAYEDFIKTYPDGRYADSAREKLEELYEDDLWEKAETADSILAYENYINKYPKGNYLLLARQRLEKAYEEDSWEKALTANTISAYEDFLMKYPSGTHVYRARDKLVPLYELNEKEIESIKETGIEKPDLISRLIMAGANCLDNDAQWTNIEQGQKLYKILKKSEAASVVESMRRVVVTSINRQRVLFFAVKLGIEGTQEALNDILIDYGDENMAEDYLNSGSGELYNGGAEWARRNGYQIMSGGGSNRMTWGEF